MSLGGWLEEWLGRCETRGLRPITVASYRTVLGLYLDQTLAELQLARLEARHLNDLYGQLLQHGRRDNRGGLAPRTVRYLHSILTKAFADAVRAGHISRSPAALADPPSRRASRPPVVSVWSPDELASFLRSAQEDEHFAAFQLAAATGLRRSELLGLRWCDVDLDARHLQVVQTVIEVDHQVWISQPKTERSRRLVALDRKTAGVLTEHRHALQAAGRNVGQETLVFLDEDGNPLHPARFSYYFQRRIRIAGLRRIRLHDLRHTHATHALQVGVHPKVVSERLGHSTIAITLDTYSHVLPSMQREAAEAVAALLVD